MPLPNTIAMGYTDFKVRARKGLPGMYGAVQAGKGLMFIDTDVDPYDMLDTVLHECLHILFDNDNTKLVPDDQEERLVTVTANKLTELFVRNPELVDWIQEVLRKEED